MSNQMNPSLIQRLESLSNELQDMIFHGLGRELANFLQRRGTSSSALKAFWLHYCRNGPRVDCLSQAGKASQHAIREFRRLDYIRKAISVRSAMSVSVNELALVVPTERIALRPSLEIDDRIIIKRQMPVGWNADHIRYVLDSLPSLECLRLYALRIPRDDQVTIPFVDIRRSTEEIEIPSHVKHLCIEEVETPDKAKSAARHVLEPVSPYSPHKLSCTFERFPVYDKIKRLHLKVPFPDAELFWNIAGALDVEHLQLQVAKHEDFTRDDMTISDALWGAISKLPRLTSLDLDYPCHGWGLSPFVQVWHDMVPQLAILRLPLPLFMCAVACVSWTNNLHIEIQVDFDDVLTEIVQRRGKESTHSEYDSEQLEQEVNERMNRMLEPIKDMQKALRLGKERDPVMHFHISIAERKSAFGRCWFKDPVEERGYIEWLKMSAAAMKRFIEGMSSRTL